MLSWEPNVATKVFSPAYCGCFTYFMCNIEIAFGIKYIHVNMIHLHRIMMTSSLMEAFVLGSRAGVRVSANRRLGG